MGEVLLYCLLAWAFVEIATAYPHYFFDGERSCDQGLQPVIGHGKHGDPVWDKDIQIELVEIGMDTPVDQWEPETGYRIVVTGQNPMLVIVSTTAGYLSFDPSDTLECKRKAWWTHGATKSKQHEVLWHSPPCCKFKGDMVQIVTTAALCKRGNFRQNQLEAFGNCEGKCDADLKLPEPVLMDMPKRVRDPEAEDVCSLDHHHEGSNGSTAPADKSVKGDEGSAHDDVGEGNEVDQGVAASNAGEEGTESDGAETGRGSAPLAMDTTSASDSEADSTGATESVTANQESTADSESSPDSARKQGARAFGVFVLLIISVAVAGGVAVILIRRRRLRMQYQDFGALEMRGYSQWSHEAGM